MDKICAIVLAAGKGTRLNDGRPSPLPKVLHQICGRPMIEYTLDTLKSLKLADIIIVVGYQAEKVKEVLGPSYSYVIQEPQQGTGHAVMCAKNSIPTDCSHVLVINGDDSAFYLPETIKSFIDFHRQEEATISLLTLEHPNPKELGRIIRNEKGEVIAIREKEDRSEEESEIKEINTATYCFEADWLKKNLDNLKMNAKKQEYFLPDLISLTVSQGEKVCAYKIDDISQWVGINDKEQLAQAEELMGRRLNQ